MDAPLKRRSRRRAAQQPEIVRRVVVLPAPFAPISVTISPCLHLSDDALSAWMRAVGDVDRSLSAASLTWPVTRPPGRPRSPSGSLWISSRRADRDGHAVVEHGDRARRCPSRPACRARSAGWPAELVADPADQLHELVLLLRVHAGGRLVEQQELRVAWPARARSRAGAAGRRAGSARGSSASAVELEDLEQLARLVRRCASSSCVVRAGVRARPPSSPPSACGAHADEHVVEHGEVANRRMFWNVRAMPSAVDLVRLQPVDAPARRSRTSPAVGP